MTANSSRRRFFARLLDFYNGVLHRHKYPVQIVTGGVLWFSGDLLAQSLVHAGKSLGSSSNPEKGLDGSVNAQSTEGVLKAPKREKGPLVYDWERVGRMTVYGLAISAPVYAFWYSYLDRWSHDLFSRKTTIGPSLTAASGGEMILPARLRHFLQRFPRLDPLLRPASLLLLRRLPPQATLRLWQMIGFKLAADCFLFDPLYLTLFFSTTAALERRSLSEIQHKLRHDLLPTYLVDIAVWLPIQTVNFRWVPVVYQALFVQSCNVGWNAYLSFVQHREEADHGEVQTAALRHE
jgi:hypothetical protein